MSAARKKAWAKKAVMEAGLSLLKRHVNRARELLDDGHDVETAADALSIEFKGAAA